MTTDQTPAQRMADIEHRIYVTMLDPKSDTVWLVDRCRKLENTLSAIRDYRDDLGVMFRDLEEAGHVID